MITGETLNEILNGARDRTVFDFDFNFFYSKVAGIQNGLVFFEMEDGSTSEVGYLTGEPNLNAGDVVLIFQRGRNDFAIICRLGLATTDTQG
jgi:hypothetical protein